MENYILVKNLSRVYGGKKEVPTIALEDVNFSFNKGEINSILGASGSGKTTLLNCLSGLDKVTNGSIMIDNVDVTKLKDKELTKFRRKNVGFIFQTYNLVYELTVKENIMLAGELVDDPYNIDEIIKIVGLEEQKDKFPFQLSGGQQQRVAIARAIIKKPKLLFADEPTGALDEKSGKDVLNLIKEVNKDLGITVIMVTHNPGMALIGQKILKLNSGKLIEDITNENVIDAADVKWD